MIAGSTLFIWEDAYPVSMAAAVREVTGCRFIGHVYTPPHFRGNGYSTACVSALTQKLLDDGYRYVALYADCGNPYSNAVYRKIGYKEVFWYDQYKVKE
jgi:predicted GNAT family acetyltransferase